MNNDYKAGVVALSTRGTRESQAIKDTLTGTAGTRTIVASEQRTVGGPSWGKEE